MTRYTVTKCAWKTESGTVHWRHSNSKKSHKMMVTILRKQVVQSVQLATHLVNSSLFLFSVQTRPTRSRRPLKSQREGSRPNGDRFIYLYNENLQQVRWSTWDHRCKQNHADDPISARLQNSRISGAQFGDKNFLSFETDLWQIIPTFVFSGDENDGRQR